MATPALRDRKGLPIARDALARPQRDAAVIGSRARTNVVAGALTALPELKRS